MEGRALSRARTDASRRFVVACGVCQRDTARAMSQENVETVRAGIEAWNADDMDALVELYDPDAIMRAPDGWPEPGPFVGRDAVLHQFKQLRATWSADTGGPDQRLQRRRRPSAREGRLERRGAGAGDEHRVHGGVHGAQAE